MASLLACSGAHASCGTTFCSVNTNWDEHSLGQKGWSADVRYSFSHADQLRSGTDKISADTANAGEVENVGTYNSSVTTSLSYTINEHWGTTVIIPYINRTHEHNIGPYSGATPADHEKFHASALGDIKILGRYRWTLNEESNAGVGVKFGLKLSNGKKDITLQNSVDVPEEVSLQPGNGSSELIVGVFWQQADSKSDWSWFAQGSLQTSVKSDDAFKPGNQINLDGGSRYAVSHAVSALLQINAQINRADSGDSAALTENGAASSGGRAISLSPGISYAMTRHNQIYGLVQLPIYQYVNGEQLTPSASYAVGFNHRF